MNNLRHYCMVIFGIAAVAAGLCDVAGVALAQSTTSVSQPAIEASPVEEIVVTASRVSRPGYLAPTPTTVLDQDLLNAMGTTNIADALNAFPEFHSSFTPANSGPRSFQAGVNTVDLRSLGPQRTLTLIDGRRIVPDSTIGQVDLNLLPSLLIDHVDVVTGGASAQWGSDAVAGVVNLLTKKNIEGIQGDVSWGESEHQDNHEKHVSLATGFSFAEGKGHLMVGGDYVDNNGVGNIYTRSWGRQENGIAPNPTPSNGLSANLLVPGYHVSNMSPGGIIVSGPLKGTAFGPGGTPYPFRYGNFLSPSFMSGGDGYGLQPTYTSADLVVPLERENALGRVNFEFSEHLSLYAEAAGARSQTVSPGAAPQDAGNLTISVNNAYLPAPVKAAMASDKLTSVTIGRDNFDLGYEINRDTTTQQRYVIGGKGEIVDSWHWDAYVQYGDTNYQGDIDNARNQLRWKQSVAAVLNPANGEIVCQTTLANPGNGCIAANIFGTGSISAAAKAYFMGSEAYNLGYSQKVAAANLHGEPLSTWAGSVSLAAGVEHRLESAHGVSDPLSEVSSFNIGNRQNISGEFAVTEGYIETVVPLLANKPLAKSVDFDGAVRRAGYSTIGEANTWKVGLNYAINGQVRIRINDSQDLRAPNISELYTAQAPGILFITNPATLVQNAIPNIATGNPHLRPEIARTFTGGIVLTPDFLPRFHVSADYYEINLNDAISTVSAQTEVNRCYAGQISFCQYVNIVGGVIQSVIVPTINLASVVMHGVDVEGGYELPLETVHHGLPGSLGLNFVGTYVFESVVSDGTTSVNHAGEVGNDGSPTAAQYNGPRLRWNLFATYSNGPVSFTLAERYIGRGFISAAYNTSPSTTISNNSIGAYCYTDLSVRYDLRTNTNSRQFEVYGLVENLFDRAPPADPTGQSPTNPVNYDVIGRTFKAGFRFKY